MNSFIALMIADLTITYIVFGIGSMQTKQKMLSLMKTMSIITGVLGTLFLVGGWLNWSTNQAESRSILVLAGSQIAQSLLLGFLFIKKIAPGAKPDPV